MDGLEAAIRRFPLVPRPRPACRPLPERVALLSTKAREAAEGRDHTEASAVLNLAALLASDCGRPDLARTWCHQHARLYLTTRPLHKQAVLHALEPLVNLARLRIRASDGTGACDLLDQLHTAIATRTNTTLDGTRVPAASMATTRDEHRQIRRWLWTVVLTTTARAHATAGNWHAAHQALKAQAGMGRRMLDGRQIAVLAELTHGNTAASKALIAETVTQDAWEQAITASITALIEPSRENGDRLLATWQASEAFRPGLTVFGLRLGLTTHALLKRCHHPDTDDVGLDLARRVIALEDGYAARDILTSPLPRQLLAHEQQKALQTTVQACALGGTVPMAELARLDEAVALASTVIRDLG